jgi:hypothetical protein
MSSPIDINKIKNRWSYMPEHWCIDGVSSSIHHLTDTTAYHDFCDYSCKNEHIDSLKEKNKQRIVNLKKLLKDVTIDTCHTEGCDNWFVFEDHLAPLGYQCQYEPCSKSWCYTCLHEGKVNPIEVIEKYGNQTSVCSGECSEECSKKYLEE